MSEERQNKMVSEKNGTAGFGDTTYRKIFVGGLAWETQRETMKHYFEQFGDILEAVVINDKNTGRSKGYGFVTFKDADSAMRACQNPYPVIDGRKANCNLAFLGAQKNRPPLLQHEVAGIEKPRPPPPPRAMAPSTYFRQPIPQYAFPNSAYGYPIYPQDIYAMNYYNVNGWGGQQFPPYVYINYSSYPQQQLHGQSCPATPQYPKMIQQQQQPPFDFMPHHQFPAFGFLSVPPTSSASPSPTVTAVAAVAATPVPHTSPFITAVEVTRPEESM